MISFILRAIFFLILLGVLATLAVQYLVDDDRAETVTYTTESEGGPAERVGEVLDKGLSNIGKLTERAGEKIQEVADDADGRATTSENTTAESTSPLEQIQRDLERTPSTR